MFKKSISLVLSLAMLLSVTSGVFFNNIFDATAAEDVKVTKTLFVEDFQSYEPGVIKKATAYIKANKGNIYYELYPDDIVEIVEEENGNKYLQFTRAAEKSSNSFVMYKFPQAYSEGAYFVSYDFRPENHSQHFTQFGGLVATAQTPTKWGKTSIQPILSYKGNFYVNSKIGVADYYVAGLGANTNYAEGAFATVTQKIDFTSTSNNYTFSATYPNANGTYTSLDAITRTVSAADVAAIGWAVKKSADGADYNGPDRNNGAAVYKIDNITVSVECIDVITESVENGGEIYADEKVDLTFNEAIADNYADYVSVYKNDELASAGYSLSLSDDKKVLTLSGFSGGAEYSIKIDENLKSQDGTKAMKEAYELNFATVSDGNDDGEQDPTLLHFEDFEGYKVGVIKEGTAAYAQGSFNGIYYGLYEGDKLEIAKDETGNKYLKFTRASEGKNSSYVMYAFPQAYSGGVVSVAYDYKPEGHGKTFNHFGTVASSANGVGKNWSANKSVIQPIVSYGKNIYVHSGTGNADYYVGGINDITKYASDEYATVTQTFDFTTDANNYKFNAKYKNSGKNIGTVKRTVNTEDVNAMAWAVYKHTTAANNGPDSVSVYRIDNITVKKELFEIKESNIQNNDELYSNEAVEITFEEAVSDNYADYVSVYKNGELASAGDYVLSLSDDKTVLTVSGFASGAEYSVKIDKNIKSASGKIMSEDYELNFSIVSSGDDVELPPSVLHFEDFEGYKVGVIYEATDYIEGSKDGFYYALYAGDKIEIAKDETGNKYLKFTRASEGKNSSYVMYAFPEAYSGGVVSVAYDYKPEGHGKTFNHFGTVASSANGVGKNWSGSKAVIQPIVSYGKNIYINSGTGDSTLYIGGMNDITKYAGDEYATVTQTFDFTTDANNYKFNAKYKNSGKNIGTVKRTVNTEDVNAMAWAVYKHTTAANNGPDSVSVYRIDNITVKKELFEVTGANINNNDELYSTEAVEITFEEAVSDNAADFVSVYKDGALASAEDYTLSFSDDKTVLTVSGFASGAEYSVKIDKNIKSASGKIMSEDYELNFSIVSSGDDIELPPSVVHFENFEGYKVGVIKEATEYVQEHKNGIYYALYPGDKLEIAKDEDGNKYLKFTRASEGKNSSYVAYAFPQAYNGGLVSVSYDYKPEGHSQTFNRFGTLVSTANGFGNKWPSDKPVIQQIISYGKNIYVNSGTGDSTLYIGGINDIANYPENEYGTVKQTIDFTKTTENYTFNAKYNSNDKTKTRTVNTEDVKGIAWSVYKNENASNNGPDSVSVYRIDNITVEYVTPFAPQIVESTIENGANDVSFKTNSVVLTLNNIPVSEDTVTKENVRLYKDSVLVDSYSVSLNENAIKVDFVGLEENASYRIEVDGLTTKGPNPLTMESTYVLNFKTVGDLYVNNLALNLTEEANVFNFTAKIFNNTEIDQPYQAFLVVRGNDGTFKNLYLAEENTVLSHDSADISISGVEVDLAENSCELFVWKSLAGLEPLLEKVTINSINAGKTLVFAQGANSVLVDGELISEETSIYKNGDDFVIPAALASKYIIETDSDLTAEDVSNLGWGVYVSDEYGFIAVGDDVDFNDTLAMDTISKFGIFVSVEGDDSYAGYASSPVQTLARAIEIYESGNNQPIFVHAGTYRLTETLNLSSKSSGLTIKDFGDGEVKVSGAVELPAIDFADAASDKIPESAKGFVKKIDLSSYIAEEMTAYPEYKAQHASTAYYELFAGDVAQTIARWPNEGFETIDFGGIFGEWLEKDDEIPVTREKVNLWKNAENGMLAGYFAKDWAFENILIDRENSSGSNIKLSKVPTYKIENGQRYYAMNMLEELDIAGEYYIDTNDGNKILYYYPTDAFGSINPELSVMKDALVSTTNANNVKISGITFENTRGKGVVTSGGSISLDNCVLRNIGNNAVSLESSNSEVVNSHIYSIGGPAVTVTAGNNDKLTSGNVRIANNEIHNFGRIFRSYQGAIHLNGCGNVAEYNTIYDAPHSAIRFSGSNHQILNNEIYNVVKETCDAGAIYAGRSWTGWGNEIKNNYFHDIKDNVGSDSKVVAVYIDDMFSGVTVENNVIEDCECAALFGGGRGNKFIDNTVVDCTIGLQYDSKGEGSSHMKVDADDSSDTVLEAFIKYIAKDSVVNSMEERYENYHGFETLVNDVNAYVADNSYAEIGYAKDAVITGNCFYGANVNKGSYFNVVDRVKNNGEYAEGTIGSTVPEYSIPDCGVRN